MVNIWASLVCKSQVVYNSHKFTAMDPNQFENDIPSDALDALADLAYEQEEAMREELNQPEVYDDQT